MTHSPAVERVSLSRVVVTGARRVAVPVSAITVLSASVALLVGPGRGDTFPSFSAFS